MNNETVNNFSGVWQQIRQWPSKERLVLASRILESLRQDSETHVVSGDRSVAINNLIGIWKHRNTLGDDDIKEMIEEERLKKFG